MSRNIEEYQNKAVVPSKSLSNSHDSLRKGSEKLYKGRYQSSSVCDVNNNEVDDDLICFVCQKQYKNPKLLPCLHTFCKCCVESYAQSGKQGFRVECPLCSWVKQVNRKDVDVYLEDLASDFVALNALDGWAMNTLDDDAVTCGGCSSNAQAVSRCSECALFLCVSCERTHRRTKTTKNHNVCSLALLNVQASESMHKITYCKSHTGEELTHYCNTCNRSICNDCTFLDHPKSTHAVTTLSVVTPTHRRQLAELLSNARRKLPFLKRTLVDIDSVLEALPDHADAVARGIARNTENFIRALKQRQEQLLDDLTKLCLHKVRVLQEQKTRIQCELDALEANCQTTEKILKTGSDSEISSVNNLVCERMQLLCGMAVDIEPEETAEFGYDADEATLIDAIHNNGRVCLAPADSSLKMIGDGLNDAAVGKVSMFTLAKAKHCDLSLEDIDVRIETPDSVILACDVEQSDGLFNVFYNPKVSGEHEISITVRGEHLPDSPVCVNVKKGHMTFTKTQCVTIGRRGNSPGSFDHVCDVAVRNNGHILAADSLNHRVQEFNCNGTFLSEFGKKGEDLGRLLYPAGLAISPEGHVIVTEHGNHRVQVFTTDGVYLWSFGAQGDTEGLMDHPTGVAVDEDGQLVIVDQHNHRVQVFNKQGHFKRQFGCYGNQHGQFDRPMYAAISQDGEILVTDSGNHRIQVFDEYGRFRRAFGRPGTGDGEFYYPSGITIDACGYVFVSDKSNRIQVFTSELEFVAKLDTRDKGDGKLDCPMGLDYTPEGKIAVADKGNHRVKVLYN